MNQGREAKPPNRRQWGLRSLFVGMVCAAVVQQVVGRPWVESQRVHRQDRALAARKAYFIQREEGRLIVVRFEAAAVSDELVAFMLEFPTLEELSTFEYDHIHNLVKGLPATGLTDAGVERLSTLRHLRRLHLHGRGVTDASLERLGELPTLIELECFNTSVTSQGIDSFRARRPDCGVASYEWP